MGLPIRVVLADRHRVVVEALAAYLAGQADMEVAGTAVTAAELVGRVRSARPQVILSDAVFEDGSVLQIAAAFRRERPDVRLVLLLESAPEVLLHKAAPYAAGCLLKAEPLSAVLSAVRGAAAGEFPMSQEIAPRLCFDRNARRFLVRADDPVTSLTDRQVHVLRLFARGRSVREVARQLFLSEKGAESQRYRLMRRLGLSDRADLTRLAIREGFISA
jgi:DNA-binding NarL/FixJ family response regulator